MSVNGLVIGDNLDVPKLEILLGEREVDSEYKFSKTVTKLYFKRLIFTSILFSVSEDAGDCVKDFRVSFLRACGSQFSLPAMFPPRKVFP